MLGLVHAAHVGYEDGERDVTVLIGFLLAIAWQSWVLNGARKHSRTEREWWREWLAWRDWKRGNGKHVSGPVVRHWQTPIPGYAGL